MSHISSSSRSPQPNPHENMGEVMGLVGLGVAIYFLASGASVFEASMTAGCVVLSVIAVCVVLSIAVYRKSGGKSWPFVLLMAAILWALLGGKVVFQNHWLAFTPAAWVFNGLYIAALLSGAWTTISAWLKFLAGLMAVSLVAATMLLPRPPGGEGPGDTNKKWKVDVQVFDE